MVIGNSEAANAAGGANNNSMSHPSGIPQDKIDNIMSGIANTGDVKMNNHRKKLRQRFDIIKKLGQGTYGKVQLGINKETGQEVAIKTIKKCKIEAEADLVRIRREVQIMSSVQHPNIIHIYEVFENREKMVLVMEFAAGGELYDYLSERKVLSEEEARRIFRQVSTAVYYCHKHKICHRDLKLENILLDEQGNAKIADFGLSNVFDDQRLLATFCGSPLYASPEIVEGTPYQGPEVDCWSLGVLLYTLVYGSMPFDGSNFKRLVKQISQGDYYEPKKPSRASTLIRDMLTVCPRKRATIEQICSHWWVNENDNVSCLDLAEDLANQTPVRLDVLLSLTPIAITADQLVVPSADGSLAGKGSERVPRSHSVGSIRDISTNTEAERRILDMVAAGGEAALMPSPTRTITPAQSPIQSKRKLENTVSTENAAGAVKKKEKPGSSALFINENISALNEEEIPMETEDIMPIEQIPTAPAKQTSKAAFSKKDIEAVGDLCAQLMQQQNSPTNTTTTIVPQEAINIEQQLPPPPRQKTVGKLDSVEEAPEEKDATKVIKKFVNKHKTADLVNAINQSTPSTTTEQKTTASSAPIPPTTSKTTTSTTTPTPPTQFVRKCSLQDESQLNKFNERRKSRILETAEKFQQMNAGANGAEKPKKFVLPGVSVGSFKKEFERKATEPPPQGPTAGERRALEQVAAAAAAEESVASSQQTAPLSQSNSIEGSDSKNSMTNFSLDDARRSMENSIALLRQAQNESTKEVDQLCAKTQNIGVTDEDTELERERKLQNARAIIGNAIQPVIRRPVPQSPPPPLPPFIGIGGSGNNKFGGGDLTNMRTTGGGGNFIGYGGSCGASGIVSPTLNPSSTFLSNTQTSPLLQSNTNVALAKARQNIIEHLGLGSSDALNRNSFSSQHSVPLQTSPHLMQQLQQQQQQCRHKQQQQKQHPIYHQNQYQSHYHNQNHMSMIPCLPPYAASASSAPSTPIATTPTATAAINSSPKPFYNIPPVAYSSAKSLLKSSPGGDPNAGTVKTSSAQITLKSATLPRRKTAKTEIQLDIKPRIVEQSPMRFTTEMQHPIADLRSAPARDGPLPYSPITTAINPRASSLEPKEHIIPIQRPQVVYNRTGSNTTNTTRSGSLSRQSTVESESDTTATNLSQSTITGSSQPIKKSPREFIIPIAVEGGGFITPREGSMEPSESSHTTSSRSTFSRLRPTRRIGSLLNETSVEEGLPFQKMKTASINRDIDDDSRFTLHRLRSSRPVKKISQENDSQSSGEEDDDDGFEILTAENLFSTLLQRVRALTNRLNVNNDITSGFPNSSRLLNNLRQGQSSFWNQEPFGSRLNNAGTNVGGAPWRHSMTRDLDNDMDSMFSRTGATLPRGNKNTKLNRKTTIDESSRSQTDNIKDVPPNLRLEKEPADEPLDLADLDLSRLRLSKKDLETLSSITPGLPKCFQEQLLAKLPPTQARKLSRTLSMQNNPQSTTTVKIYKRSQSGGRGLSQDKTSSNDLKENITAERKEAADNTTALKSTTQSTVAAANKTSDENSDRSSSLIYHRSLSRTRYDYDTLLSNTESSAKSRSNSVCRDDYGKSLCSSYSSDISDKYKYYSPYLAKSNVAKDTSNESGSSLSPHKRYGSVSPRESCHSPNTSSGNSSGVATLGRPPSGCLSPPPDACSSSLRRRPSQRRISRFLRPDFFDEPAEDSPFYREKKLRERETQSVLREIREKSRESSRDRLSQSSYSCEDSIYRRKHSLSGDEAQIIEKADNPRHVRNKSMEMYSDRQDSGSSSQDAVKCHRRSLSRSRELYDVEDKNDLADKILTELQILSAVKSQQEKRLSVPREVSVEKTANVVKLDGSPTDGPLANANDEIEKTATIKRVKKLKAKEKTAESPDDLETKAPTTLVKKVKKIIKKTDSTKIPIKPIENVDDQEKCATTTEIEKPKPESKLKRPKSYPTKDQTISITKVETSAAVLPTKLPTKSTTNVENCSEVISYTTTKPAAISASIELRENRLVRPKSYPASKLTPPKDVKKTTLSGVAIPSTSDASSITTSKSTNSRQSTSEEKSSSTTVTPTGKSSIDTSSSSESRPTAIKKIIKVTKKSKLVQPTALTSAATTGEDISENLTITLPQKEKSPEKKASKGLLYAIGQKFEKLRDSAMNKDKKSLSSATSASIATGTITKRSSPDKASPEKIKEKSKILKKKKSLDGTTTKTEKNIITPSEDASKTSKNVTSSNELPDKPTKSDKRSRIDAMIRSLRERSVPRSQPVTESNYIKRAVSVEDMPGTFNKNTVNKVLGLFKRFEKDGSERKVRSTRSTSNIDRQSYESSDSPIYQNARGRPKSIGFTTIDAKHPMPNNKIICQKEIADCASACSCKANPAPPASSTTTPLNKFPCPDCIQDQASSAAIQNRNEESKPHDTMLQIQEQSHGNKDRRKALMLDLAKLEKLDNNSSVGSRTKAYPNGNGIYSNLPPYPGATVHNQHTSQHNDNATNNNNTSITNNNNQMSAMQTNYHPVSNYRTSSAHEINRNNMFSPSSENIANYSSDSRSYQDDCASTSTFLSPTDEPELYFDNWSVCSEDNYMLATPSPTVSRLSRASQLSSPTRGGDGSDPNESIIDRIKRRSFYSRFNEKKPKRTSSIVGPTAVRDYYREQQAAVKSRASNSNNSKQTASNSDRAPSPDITQQFFRPLKLSPVGTELKPPIYKSPLDYSSTAGKPRKSLNDIRPMTSPSFLSKRYGSSAVNSNDNDYLLFKSAVPTRIKNSTASSAYENNGGYYSTYNPKRRSSYNLNGMLPSGSNVSIDGYATVGRRTVRPYDQRTYSLLGAPTPSATTSFRREVRTPIRDYSSSISRSNSNYRSPAPSRSPTNI